MFTGTYYLEIGLVIAAVVAILWWAQASSAKAHARRQVELSSKRLARQAWGNEGAGGRGIR